MRDASKHPAEARTTGRLEARPGVPSESAEPGLHVLGQGADREALLYIPKGLRAAEPHPLAVLLHGAGGNAQGGLMPLMGLADEAQMPLLAPESRGGTWDVILGGFGPDITVLDRALASTFARCAVDPARLAIGGFSDGASYALSVGLTNGDLFSHILAFSPGFLAPAAQVGAPRIFVSHGTRDAVLPIDSCSRRLVPVLRDSGYDLTYREFDGPHTVPVEIALEALEWYTQP